MSNKITIWIAASFGVGTVAGFVLGYSYGKKMKQSEVQNTSSQTVESVKMPEQPKVEPANVNVNVVKTEKIISGGAAKIAMPDRPGIDYTKYAEQVDKLKYKVMSEAPTDGDDTELEEPEEINEEDMMETYEERIEREQKMINEELDAYTQKKGKNIDVLGKQPLDHEWPDVHYDEEELKYFIPDDILTDDLGNRVNEKELIGDKLRRFNWFSNAQEDIWVRNNPLSRDYHIVKINDDYRSYFPDMDDEED